MSEIKLSRAQRRQMQKLNDTNLEGADPDLDEAAARGVFEWVAEPYREVEAQMCRVAGLRS